MINTEKNLDQLFASARTEAPRLSYDQVSSSFVAGSSLGIVESIRTLINPIIKYKSMIAITAGSLITGTAVLLMITGVNRENSMPLVKEQQIALEENDPNQNEVNTKTFPLSGSEESTDLVAKGKSDDKKTIATRPQYDQRIAADIPRLEARPSTVAPKYSRAIEIPKIDNNQMLPQESLANMNSKNCEDLPDISDSDLKKLRQDIVQKVKNDQFIGSRAAEVKIELSTSNLSINGQLLSKELGKEYLDQLAEYEITPCPERIIEITSDYFMIGKVTPKGFMGIFSGTLDTKDLKRKHKTATSNDAAAYESRIIRLSNTATDEEKRRFENAIRSAGLEIYSVDHRGKGGPTERLTLHLRHEDGLDWRLRATGFEFVELKFFITDNGELVKFSHRFNQEGEFSDPVSMASQGRISVKHSHQDF